MADEKNTLGWDKSLIGIAGPVISAVIGALLAWLPGKSLIAIEPGLTVIIIAAGGIAGVVFSIMYQRYLGVLEASAEPKGTRTNPASPERKAYDRLRESLRGGNVAARLYADWLTRFLDAVDRFFGDAGMADRTLFPHAFGLTKPAPLWTAPAFDRCLLLALIYPILTIFVIWAASGHVGPAEAALRLEPDVAGWGRVLVITGFALIAIFLWRSAVAFRAEFIVRGTIWYLSAFAIAFAIAFAGAGVGAFAVAIAIAFAFAVAVAFAVAFAFAFAFAVAFAGVGAFAVAVAFAVAFAGVGAVAVLNNLAINNRWQSRFLALLCSVMMLGCLGAAYSLSAFDTWGAAGPLLLFLGLLTLINAPFDWASLGITRALLRRGLELKSWWPLALALGDAALAVVIVAALALAMVVAVQAFDDLAVLGGGNAVLPLIEPQEGSKPALFDGIANNPSAPEYWWAYALLLSTLIPSLINLMIGATSLFRGLPGVPNLLLRFMPASQTVAKFDRAWIALVLTAQAFFGVIAGILVQAFLVIAVVFHIMPWLGLGLLDTLRDVAEFDLPMRIINMF